MGEESRKVSRRDFLKMLGPGVAGAYVALKSYDLLPTLPEPEIGDDSNWNAGELGIQAFLDKGEVKYYARPYGYPRFEATLKHIGSSVLSETSPHKALFVGSEPLVGAVSEESYTKSTGYANRVVASMYPVEAGFKLASIKQNKIETAGVSFDSRANCSLDREGNTFEWEIEATGDKYKGNGFVRAIEPGDKINFVSGSDFGDRNVVGMKPSRWLKETTGTKNVTALGGESFGTSLEHTTPSVWIVEGEENLFALAASYANHGTLAFAEEIQSDRKLTPAENNYLNSPTPFVVGSDMPTDTEADFIATLPEKTFSAWKEKYPDKPFHQGQTFLFDREKGTFRVVGRTDRRSTIKSLSKSEVWLTPGEVMLLNGEEHFSDETRFKDSLDMTLNGFLAVPVGDGTYRPVQVVTTDQRLRFSLNHAEQIANGLREQMELPEGTILINWDKHGAGGVFVGVNDKEAVA